MKLRNGGSTNPTNEQMRGRLLELLREVLDDCPENENPAENHTSEFSEKRNFALVYALKVISGENGDIRDLAGSDQGPIMVVYARMLYSVPLSREDIADAKTSFLSALLLIDPYKMVFSTGMAYGKHFYKALTRFAIRLNVHKNILEEYYQAVAGGDYERAWKFAFITVELLWKFSTKKADVLENLISSFNPRIVDAKVPLISKPKHVALITESQEAEAAEP